MEIIMGKISGMRKTLKLKQEIFNNREYNINLVKRYEGAADAETNIEKFEDLNRMIRKGEAYISMQTTKLLELSARKISRLFDVPECKVNYEYRMLTTRKF
jgi:lactam utilization protein B